MQRFTKNTCSGSLFSVLDALEVHIAQSILSIERIGVSISATVQEEGRRLDVRRSFHLIKLRYVGPPCERGGWIDELP